MAGLPTRHGAVRDYLDRRGLGDMREPPLEAVPPAARDLGVLAGIAARRPGVVAVVLTVPDRFGGDPRTWWGTAGRARRRRVRRAWSRARTRAPPADVGATWAHPWSGPSPVALGSAPRTFRYVPPFEETLP